MHLFLVVSETLYETIPVLDDGSGPSEPYKIVCLVSAKTREQARWTAWQTDRSFDASDMREMPKFKTRKLGVSNHLRMVIEEQFDDETGSYTNEWGDIPANAWFGT